VKTALRQLLGCILLAGGIALGAAAAEAHPHVWITAKSEVIYAADGTITGVESLKEFGYFTFAKADGKKERFLEPVDYFLEYKDSLLTLHFTLPAKAPFKAKQAALEVFDPSYFIDFKFEDKDPVKLVGAPAACQMKFQRPNDGTAAAQRLSENNFMNGDNSNYGAMFANKIMVECP